VLRETKETKEIQDPKDFKERREILAQDHQVLKDRLVLPVLLAHLEGRL
jgi:hypothetical protein